MCWLNPAVVRPYYLAPWVWLWGLGFVRWEKVEQQYLEKSKLSVRLFYFSFGFFKKPCPQIPFNTFFYFVNWFSTLSNASSIKASCNLRIAKARFWVAEHFVAISRTCETSVHLFMLQLLLAILLPPLRNYHNISSPTWRKISGIYNQLVKQPTKKVYLTLYPSPKKIWAIE